MFAPRQFHAGTHNTGVLAVADEQPVPFSKGQSPQRQHAAAGDVFGECEAMGCHTTHASQQRTRLVCFRTDIGPYIRGERPQFLDALPACGHGL